VTRGRGEWVKAMSRPPNNDRAAKLWVPSPLPKHPKLTSGDESARAPGVDLPDHGAPRGIISVVTIISYYRGPDSRAEVHSKFYSSGAGVCTIPAYPSSGVTRPSRGGAG
jgi:hypothetical protein